MEFFDIVDKNDKIIGKINSEMQSTVKPSQLRFINIILINDNEEILVPKRSSNRKIFPNCYDFSVGGHVNSGEEYIEAAYRELKEELGIKNVELQEIAYFSPFKSSSNTFQKVYILKYNEPIIYYDHQGIEKLYYMTKKEIIELLQDKPEMFKTDYFFVMNYLFKNEKIWKIFKDFFKK